MIFWAEFAVLAVLVGLWDFVWDEDPWHVAVLILPLIGLAIVADMVAMLSLLGF